MIFFFFFHLNRSMEQHHALFLDFTARDYYYFVQTPKDADAYKVGTTNNTRTSACPLDLSTKNHDTTEAEPAYNGGGSEAFFFFSNERPLFFFHCILSSSPHPSVPLGRHHQLGHTPNCLNNCGGSSLFVVLLLFTTTTTTVQRSEILHSPYHAKNSQGLS